MIVSWFPSSEGCILVCLGMGWWPSFPHGLPVVMFWQRLCITRSDTFNPIKAVFEKWYCCVERAATPSHMSRRYAWHRCIMPGRPASLYVGRGHSRVILSPQEASALCRMQISLGLSISFISAIKSSKNLVCVGVTAAKIGIAELINRTLGVTVLYLGLTNFLIKHFDPFNTCVI